MIQFIAYFVPLLLILFTLITFRMHAYQDKTFTKQARMPIWVYLVIIVSSIVPGLNWIILIFGLWMVFTLFKEAGSPYYKPGWFIKLLTKTI